jgi:hypothetical protein
MELLFPAFIILVIYFIPTGIAANRQHPQFGAICALNILLRWTPHAAGDAPAVELGQMVGSDGIEPPTFRL